jgi:hypothetical protein
MNHTLIQVINYATLKKNHNILFFFKNDVRIYLLLFPLSYVMHPISAVSHKIVYECMITNIVMDVVMKDTFWCCVLKGIVDIMGL